MLQNSSPNHYRYVGVFKNSKIQNLNQMHYWRKKRASMLGETLCV